MGYAHGLTTEETMKKISLVNSGTPHFGAFCHGNDCDWQEFAYDENDIKRVKKALLDHMKQTGHEDGHTEQSVHRIYRLETE